MSDKWGDSTTKAVMYVSESPQSVAWSQRAAASAAVVGAARPADPVKPPGEKPLGSTGGVDEGGK